MTLLHKAVFVGSALMAAIWTFLFWRLAFPRKGPPRTLLGKCCHHWHRIESYDDGRAKARCLKCGRIAIVNVRHRSSRS